MDERNDRRSAEYLRILPIGAAVILAMIALWYVGREDSVRTEARDHGGRVQQAEPDTTQQVEPGISAQEDQPPDTSRYGRAGLVEVRTWAPDLLVDLKYAGSDNFLGRALYSDLTDCYLRPEAARMLAAADSILRAQRPDLRLLLLDCVRPLDVQRELWNQVRGTPLQRYVANPSRGSMHNYGTAVDITLANLQGEQLDMGTPYDSLGEASQPREEDRLLRRGMLSQHQVGNRRLLRSVMKEAGFRPIEIEWWHFEAFDKERTRREFTIIP